MLRKWFYHRWLLHWAGDSTLDSMPSVKVKRRFDFEDLYVDVYWVMTDESTGKSEQFYQRMDWFQFLRRASRMDARIIKQYIEQKKRK